MSVSKVSKKCFRLGEGPHWEVRTQRLYFVDVPEKEVCLLDPITGETEIVNPNGLASFVIPYLSDPSSLLISSFQQIKKLNFNTGQTEVICQLNHEDPKCRFNDGKCDAKGRLWTGTMLHETIGTVHQKGHLYKLDNSYKLTEVESKVSISNGLAWTSNNDTMFYIDTDPRIIYAFDYNLKEGSLSNKRVLIDYNKENGFEELGLPDGMAIDTENKIWVANFGGGCILRIDPETKAVLKRIDIPSKYVTSCCFGGPNLDILYVTTAAGSDEHKKEYPEAGAIFAVTGHGCIGYPPNSFRA